MITSSNIKKYFSFEYICLFLIGLELLGHFHFVVFLLALVMLQRKKIETPTGLSLVAILLFSILTPLFYHESMWSAVLPLAWICIFLIGYSCCKDNRSAFVILLCVAIGYGIQGLLTAYYGADSIVAIDEDSRWVKSFWGDSERSISAQNVTMYLFSGLLVYIIQNQNIKRIWKILAISFELGFFYNTMVTAMRSSLIMPPIIIFISLLAYMRNSKAIGRIIFIAILLIVACIVLYQVDFLGFKSMYEGSYLLSRLDSKVDGGIAHNSRFELQSRFFDVWMLAPFGGLHQKTHFYFHNAWLDFYGNVGIVPSIVLIAITLNMIFKYFFLFKRVDNAELSYLTGTMLAFFLPFYMDPMYDAAPCYFSLFLMFYGMITKRYWQVKIYGINKENINESDDEYTIHRVPSDIPVNKVN